MSQNPGLLVVVSILVIASAVLGSICSSLSRAGLSTKPVIFLAVFLGMILLPGLLFFTMQAIWPVEALVDSKDTQAYESLGVSSLGPSLNGVEHFDNPRLLFGADVDPSLVRDAKTIYAAAFSRAEIAQMAFLPSGETVAVARFAEPESALKAAAALRAIVGISSQPAPGQVSSYWGRRPNAYSPEGDALLQQTIGAAVVFWSGPSREAVLARRAKSAFAPLAATAASRLPASPNVPSFVRFFRQTSTHAALTILLVIAASIWFFKGTAWAARIEPQNEKAITAPELESRLLALTRNGKLEAEFHYETIESKFTREAHFVLEPARQTVRVLEFERTQGKGAEILRATRSGIIFFQKAAGDAEDPMSSYRDVVSQAGWIWQPDLWQVPDWLRGLLG